MKSRFDATRVRLVLELFNSEADMTSIRMHLFGQFRLTNGNQEPVGLPTRRAEELISYLVLNRQRAHSRERLAELLWDGASTTQSRKYLRHTLWQVQSALACDGDRSAALLIEPEWIGFTGGNGLWVDVLQFEAQCSKTHRNGSVLSDRDAEALKSAVELYEGDLLEGWYCDWCQGDRERLQGMLVTLLDRLMEHSEAHHRFDEAIALGQRVLACDRARERTHCLLMRLHYLAGDRTAALRQYERCVAALKHELGVAPARATAALYEEIRADRLGPALAAAGSQKPADVAALSQIQALLTDTQSRIEAGLSAVERALAANSSRDRTGT